MSRSALTLPGIILAASASACATPAVQRGSAAPETQLAQQELVIASDVRQQQRVDHVGHRLLAAATPYCAGAVATRGGFRFANIHSFPSEYQNAARALGFSDTLIIVSVARGSAAARVGIAVGDRVIGADEVTVPRGPSAASLLARAIAARGATPTRLTLRHGGLGFLPDPQAGGDNPDPVRTLAGDRRVSVPVDTVCGYNVTASRKDEVNAWADGSTVTVTSAMLRFVTDDGELAAVLAHQIAHNAMGHIGAMQRKVTGGSFGAVVDTAAATRGGNARGASSKQAMDIGSIVFSPDLEREADEVAMYLLARSSWPLGEIPGLWRRVAQYDPHSIKYAGVHPTSKERLVRLEQAEREVQQRVARREALQPEPRRGALASPLGSTMTMALEDAVESLSTYELSTSDSVSYTYGPAVPRNGLTLAEVRRRALQAYQDGKEAIELRLYAQAEARFREAVLYDGSEARYHAALGEILIKRGKRAEAEAVLSAAVLLDVDNAEYRRLLIEARQREP